MQSSERQKIQLEDIDRVIAADAKHNETRREEFLADCKEYGLDPKHSNKNLTKGYKRELKQLHAKEH